jgi:hypothetical protein
MVFKNKYRKTRYMGIIKPGVNGKKKEHNKKGNVCIT